MSLIGTEEISFNESGNIEQDVNLLTNDSEANALRNLYGADIAILLTDGNYQGVAGIVKEIGASASTAFAIVQVDFATMGFTFAHEAGHLQGAYHQQCAVYTRGGCAPVTVSGGPHGFGFQAGIWPFQKYKYTIMHQNGAGGTRIQYYSNPDVEYHGDDTGTANNNNALKLSQTASTMAGFRTNTMLSASITGITSGCSGTYTWSSNVSGGSGSYTYQWETSTNGITYTYAGSSSSYTGTLPPSSDLYLKLTVTSGGQEETDFQWVENLDGSPACGGSKTLVVDEDASEEAQPETFTLQDAYPNPFNPTTAIAFDLPLGSEVRLAVYDMLGREVARLVDGYREAGVHQVTFDATHLPSGVYLYRMQAGGFEDARLITLMK